LGWWAGKLAMVDTSAHPVGHMTYTQAPAVCEKKINFIEFVSLSLGKITLKLIKLSQQLMKDKMYLIFIILSPVALTSVCKITGDNKNLSNILNHSGCFRLAPY